MQEPDDAASMQAPDNAELPRPASMKDRISHQEAMICSFIAEHSLPLSLAPHIVRLAQKLAQDPKDVQSASMEGQTTDKLKHGLHKVEKKS